MTPDERLKRFMATDKQMAMRLIKEEDKDDSDTITILETDK